MTYDKLRTAVEGRVRLPGDEGFEAAARAWNLTVDQPVAAVVEAADAGDVAALVRHARKEGLTVSAQPRGHGASGTSEGVILLRTDRLDELEIHPGEEGARAGAGVNWGTVLTEAGRHGLTGLAGSNPTVTVTGYTLGGGLSWFSRRYGWAADSVRAFDVVDAEGRPARVTEESDPDLFWALRGGGGDFALVTAVEFDLYAERALYGGRVMWPGHKEAEVFAAFRELTADAPPELSLWLNRVQFPKAPPMVTVDLAYLGEAGEAEDLLGRLGKIDGVLSDTRAAMATADLGAITAEPTDPAPALARTELLTGLDAATADILLAQPVEPLVTMQIRHLGGALARPGGGAGGALTEPYLLYLLGPGISPELTRAVRAKQDAVVAALGDRVSGRKPYTFLSPGERAAQAFPEPTLARLREIKRSRDPHGVFRANYPVLD
ncbi:FAD-linked oxidase [Nonomuraea sp. WAC 01424]|uniref:FAD-binding oxidoreductase n=1 Tax=Nonomuraea sp. WAC 01424 TaxID=2203200 RepID=UPI000F76FCA7|nr:FAD-binding oxidoreductase [Nonomuraea sp. WAC 01424]RSN12646.1 FAD-linked oxidase [Nonomuraea sp. WAC 01424]